MTATAAPRRSQFKLSTFRQEALYGYLFISPWVIGFTIFALGPLLALIYLSFTRWDLVGSPSWVGLRNYSRLMSDELFWQAMKVTVVYGLGRVPLGIIVALGAA
ncbi:ABC transporter permease, partial [Litorilinea aerophila]